jgi:hypothetical protein
MHHHFWVKDLVAVQLNPACGASSRFGEDCVSPFIVVMGNADLEIGTAFGHGCANCG